MNCPRCNAELEELFEPLRIEYHGLAVNAMYRWYEHCGLVWAEADQRRFNENSFKYARYASK